MLESILTSCITTSAFILCLATVRSGVRVITATCLSSRSHSRARRNPGMIVGVHYRKSCASSGACLIASSGYQQFCTGKLNSVCISCCNTPLCNGPSQKKQSSRNRVPSAASSLCQLHRLSLLFLPFILSTPSIFC